MPDWTMTVCQTLSCLSQVVEKRNSIVRVDRYTLTWQQYMCTVINTITIFKLFWQNIVLYNDTTFLQWSHHNHFSMLNDTTYFLKQFIKVGHDWGKYVRSWIYCCCFQTWGKSMLSGTAPTWIFHGTDWFLDHPCIPLVLLSFKCSFSTNTDY